MMVRVSSVSHGQLSDMEREDYQKRINDLIGAVSTLLDSNKAMGEKLDKATAAYDGLKAAIERMESRTGLDYYSKTITSMIVLK